MSTRHETNHWRVIKGSYFNQEQWLKESLERAAKRQSRMRPVGFHINLVQGDQNLRLTNLFKNWKAKTLKHGKTFMAPLSYGDLSLLSRKR